MDWMALKHALVAHLPVAVGLLLPWALLAAQRPGRGIRPWWMVCRYLGWICLTGFLLALASGFAAARMVGLMPEHHFLPRASAVGTEGLFFRHMVLAGATALLGGLSLWAMNRPRKDHQSLGFLALILGLTWSGLLLWSGDSGYRLAHGSPAKVLAKVTPPVQGMAVPVVASPKPEADAEARLPIRALDYATLEPIHPDPVKSPAHGGRWVRAWVTPESAEAYRSGRRLPVGAMVVLSSVEDRWGRPGPEPGPLWTLEAKASGPALSFYWGRIPVERRPEFGGDARAYWRGQDAHLESCRSCHIEGMADPAKRSRWRAARIQD